MEDILSPELASIEGAEDLASQSQVDKLVGRVDKLLGKLESREVLPMDKPLTESRETSRWARLIDSLKSVWTVILIIMAAVGAGWKLHSEFSSINAQMVSLRMAVKVLAEAQDGKTKELVNDALAISAMNLGAGKSSQAQSALSIANQLMAELKSSKVPANPDFFSKSLGEFRNIRNSLQGASRLGDEVFRGTVELAEYRSSLQPSPVIPESAKTITSSIPVGPRGPSFGNGTMLFGTSGPMLTFAPNLMNQPHNWRIMGVNLVALHPETYQVLDGVIWTDVIFVNATIKYEGMAPFELHNVRFVNCTFDISVGEKGTALVEYVALNRSQLTINPDTSG